MFRTCDARAECEGCAEERASGKHREQLRERRLHEAKYRFSDGWAHSQLRGRSESTMYSCIATKKEVFSNNVIL